MFESLLTYILINVAALDVIGIDELIFIFASAVFWQELDVLLFEYLEHMLLKFHISIFPPKDTCAGKVFFNFYDLKGDLPKAVFIRGFYEEIDTAVQFFDQFLFHLFQQVILVTVMGVKSRPVDLCVSGGDFEPVSFASEKNTGIGLVQFVITTEGIQTV